MTRQQYAVGYNLKKKVIKNDKAIYVQTMSKYGSYKIIEIKRFL